MENSVTNYSPVAVRKIVREYGHPPWVIRGAIMSMRRHGSGYRQAVRAVSIVNAAHAGENWHRERERMTMPVDEQEVMRQIDLESQLARTFVRMQRERVPGERQKLWAECIRLSAELERLNDDNDNHD